MKKILPYYDARGIIYLQKPDGTEICWEVAAHSEKDNDQTLREHLKQYAPDCIFISSEIWKYW